MITRTLFLVGLFGTVLSAQVKRNPDIPLRNWATPIYWQPTQAEVEAAGVRTDGLIHAASPLAAMQPASLVFVAMTPCRVVDTRSFYNFSSPFGPPSLVANTTRTFPIQSSTLCPIPANAMAYSFNVTLVPPGPVGALTIYPFGQPQPNAVTLDDLQGQIANNAAIVPAGSSNGSVNVWVNGNTDLVIDINGYFVPTNTNPSPAYSVKFSGSISLSNGGPPTFVTSVTLPAGTYVLVAKVVSSTSTGTNLICNLGSIDSMQFNGGYNNTILHMLLGTVSFSASTVVELDCSNSGGQVTVQNAEILALAVSSLN